MTLQVTCITASAGRMFCGACARDVSLARALTELGCQVQLVPLYLPLRVDGDLPPGTTETFFGGVNVFLQQYCGLFRHTPRLIDRVFDSPPLLRLSAKFGASTDPARLGPMTLSMLKGDEGRQRKELDRLLRFLGSGPPPDVITIANMLLSGIAPSLRDRLDTPIVCTLQGADEFVDQIPEPHRARIHELMRRHAQIIDRFVSPSDAYAAKMAAYLDVPRDPIRTVPTGIPVEEYPLPAARRREPYTVGYLSRVTPPKGLDLLLDAVARLAEDGREIRLKAAGQRLDRDYWNRIQEQVTERGLADRVKFCDVPDLAGKVTFLHDCSVFSVPSRKPEIRGTAALEAMAAGLPVVLPDLGVYHEIIGLTEGGLLVPPGDTDRLADALALLQDEPERADRIGLA
ncbi:MAG: glycosyltransferase family 4 protein, partial [Planctomycetota bacterium]